MIIPNLIFRGLPAIFANYRTAERADPARAFIADFVSAIEFSLVGAGLLCPVLSPTVDAMGDTGVRLFDAGCDRIEPITVANPTLLPAVAYSRPSATVSSWQWIT
jgi:hypothetical protein